MIVVLAGRAVVWCYSQPRASEGLRWSMFGSLAALLVLAFISMGLHVLYILGVRADAPGSPDRRGSGMGWMPRPFPSRSSPRWSWPPRRRAGSSRRRRRSGGAGGGVADPAELRLPASMSTAGDPRVEAGSASSRLGSPGCCSTSGKSTASRDRAFPRAVIYTALGYGMAFGMLVLLTHLVGYLIGSAWGLDPDTIARRRGKIGADCWAWPGCRYPRSSRASTAVHSSSWSSRWCSGGSRASRTPS